MSLLRKYIRTLLCEENIKLTKGVESLGDHEVITNTFSISGGKLVVWENSPYAQGANSIYSFVVDESVRGQGIGSQLIDAMIQTYPGEEMSGQVSSLASLKVLFNKGFRPPGIQNIDFDELVKMFNDDYGSLNMRLTP
jgi:GNAT superfamily N-acetyltransferase